MQVTASGERRGGPTRADSRAGRPPIFLSSFVGRQSELAEIVALIGHQRLLTIAGPGGCGKTRLAREALVAITGHWADGVHWVDLAPVTDPSRVGDVAAAAVDVLVDPARGAQNALTRELRDRDLVLCLDGCEHLVDACAQLVETVLSACPGITVLATSREPLELPGETVWRVPPMKEAEAMDLFAERARGVRPAFVTDPSNEDAVRTVCRRLDGIPLAVELAAAWIRMFTPSQISVALDDRFGLLVGGRRGVMPRQRTLAASVAWSYDLLRDDARTLLLRVAVFSGGFTLEAAVAVCGGGRLGSRDVLVALGRLVDASLCNVDERAGESRYRLAETIREYALGLVGETAERARMRDRHLDYFVQLVEAMDAALDRAGHDDQDDQDVVLEGLEVEHDNIRAALRWGLSLVDAERGCRLAAALSRAWFLRGHAHEGIQFVQRALQLHTDHTSLLHADLLCGLALLAVAGGRVDLIDDATSRAIEIGAASGDDRILARAYALAAYVPFYVDFSAARQLTDAARRHGRLGGDAFAVDFAQLLDAGMLTISDRHDEAVALMRPLSERSVRRHDRFFAAFARAGELWAALFTGDPRRAVVLGKEAVDIARPLNDYFTFGTIVINYAWALGVAGSSDDAIRALDKVVRSLADGGPDVDVVNVGVIAGKLRLWRGELDAAVEWFEQVSRRREPIADNWMCARALPGLASALRRLGRAEEAGAQAARAVTLARELDIPHALAEALEESAHLVAAEDPTRAENLHHEALRTRVEHGLWTFVVDSLDALAGLAMAGNRAAEAVRLLGASTTARDAMGHPRSVIDAPSFDAALAAGREALGEDGFDDAWSAGCMLSLEQAVMYVSRSRGPRQRPSIGWGSLTPTEEQVVALIAEGNSNPEIAGRLFMSRATVKTHLSHVYTKLSVANRTELAALAATSPATDDVAG